MHHVMRFNATLKVDFEKWSNVKMERENNMRDAKAMEEEMPKFGAGSEYNRDLKEELRRKKFGFAPRKYKQGELCPKIYLPLLEQMNRYIFSFTTNFQSNFFTTKCN